VGAPDHYERIARQTFILTTHDVPSRVRFLVHDNAILHESQVHLRTRTTNYLQDVNTYDGLSGITLETGAAGSRRIHQDGKKTYLQCK
jgi:hypothetical protein